MYTLAVLLVQGCKAEHFMPAGCLLVQTWTEQEWEQFWRLLVRERPEGWEKLSRAIHK